MKRKTAAPKKVAPTTAIPPESGSSTNGPVDWEDREYDIDVLEKQRIQIRTDENSETITNMVEAIQQGEKLPPGVVFEVAGVGPVQADGNHRRQAYKNAGHTKMVCRSRPGTLFEAHSYAMMANGAQKALPLSNADKRKGVLLLFEIPGTIRKSNLTIARACGVSEGMVRNIRNEKGYVSPEREDAKGRVIDTTKIGQTTKGRTKAPNPTATSGTSQASKSKPVESDQPAESTEGTAVEPGPMADATPEVNHAAATEDASMPAGVATSSWNGPSALPEPHAETEPVADAPTTTDNPTVATPAAPAKDPVTHVRHIVNSVPMLFRRLEQLVGITDSTDHTARNTLVEVVDGDLEAEDAIKALLALRAESLDKNPVAEAEDDDHGSASAA